ncbi:MAG TPA: STAS domain-containing protein [Mycobacteriales bacterium]|nr:STAS domain-containing protein [Mycobacteriales bacterium]
MRARPDLRVVYDEGCSVLHVSGELDIGSAPILRETFLGLLNRDEVPDVVMDLSGVTFADSSGLAVLLMGARRWAAEGSKLVVRQPSRTLTRIVDLTGVRQAFLFEED